MVKKTGVFVMAPKNRRPPVRYRIFKYGYIGIFFALICTYLGLVFTQTPDRQALKLLHLSLGTYHWLLASIVVILVVTWLASLYGSLFIKSYAHTIRNTKEGRQLNFISLGLIVLSLSQPIEANFSSLFGLIERHHPRAVPTFTIINNYINLALMGAAMIIIAYGADGLSKALAGRVNEVLQRLWVVFFIIASSLYSYFIIIQPIHTPSARRVYYLPDWLLVCSVAIPYLIFWYLGITAGYHIYRYQQNVRGILYRSALKYLASGIAVVIVASVVTRFITTLSVKLLHLSLTPLLFIIYGLLLVDAAGFVLIAVGAKKLKRFEEV